MGKQTPHDINLYVESKRQCKKAYEAETDSWTQRTDLWLPAGRKLEKDKVGAWG